jgi:hypothetical protein
VPGRGGAAVVPRRVNTAIRGAYLSLILKPDINVYGVKINYTYETAG